MVDGTSTAAASMLYVSNAAPGDVVNLSGTSVSLAGATAGLQSITSFTGLSLSGAAATNYTLSGVSGAVTLVTPPFSVGQPAFDPFANATGGGGTAYLIGSNLVGQVNAQGLTWYAMGTGTNQPTIQSGTLTVPGLKPDSGNSVGFTGTSGGTTARLDFGTTTGNSTFYGGSSYTLYYSMSFEVTSTTQLTTTPAFVAAFSESAGTSASAPATGYARLYLRQDGAGFDIGINKADGVGTNIAWEGGVVPTVYGPNTTYFVVAGYTFSGNPGATNDSVELWVNPATNTFGSAVAPTNDPSYVTTNAGAQAGTTSLTDKLASFYLRDANALEPQGMIADEVSVGLSWADVTPIVSVQAAPFSITSEQIDNTGTNLVINWQSTPGATYRVIASTNVGAASNLWVTVGSSVTATGTNTSATNAIVPPQKFFRVKSP
jgi:hypothetical protein